MKVLSVIVTHHDQPETVLKIIERFAQERVLGAELIVVDDCSKPNNRDQVYRYAEACSEASVSMINSPIWSGAGGARNLGASVAQGAYLWFVDGDDEIYRGSVDRIVTYLMIHKDDIVMLPYTEGHGADLRTHTIEPDEAPPKPYQWRIAPWGKVIRREIFVLFCPRCMYEDTDWHFVQCDRAVTRGFLPGGPVYFYDRTPEGGSQMTGIALLEEHHLLSVEKKLALDDAVLNRAIAERLRMVARLIDAYRNGVIRRNDIRTYVRRFAEWMLVSVTK